MSVVKRVARNTTVILVTRAVTTALGIATVYVLTRFLGPANYGLHEILFAYVAIATNVVDFGFGPILTREISRKRENISVLLGNLMTMKLVLAVLAMLAVNLMVYFLGRDPRLPQLMGIYSLGILFMVGSVFQSTFAARLDVRIPSLLRTIQRILLLLLILLVVYLGGSLVHILIVELIASFFYISSGYLLSLKFLKPVFVLSVDLCKKLVRVSWPVGVFALLDQALHKVDIIVLSSFEGEASVGVYSLAARLTQFLEVFVVAVMISVFPLLSRYYKTEEEKFQAVWRFSCKYLMAVITLVCLIVYCVARPLVVAVGGEEFVEASVALRILIWSQILSMQESCVPTFL